MSGFLGVLLHGSELPTGQLVEAGRKAVSRVENDSIVNFSESRFHLFAFRSSVSSWEPLSCVRETSATFTFIAGATYTDFQPEEGISEELRRARGHFCGLTYDRKAAVVHGFVDPIGVRPLYICQGIRGLTLFSSSVGAVKRFASQIGFHLALDPQGFREEVVLATALGRKTPWRSLHLLRGGETAAVTSDGKLEFRTYWRWSFDPNKAIEDRKGRVRDCFMAAVKRRLGSSNSARAFLSGGLDSRLVVSALKILGASISTYTFSRADSLDTVLARQFASVAMTSHVESIVPSFSSGGGLPFHLREALLKQTGKQEEISIWSGDGGSVLLGHVYMDATSVDLAARKDFAGTARHLVDKVAARMSRRILRGDSVRSLRDFEENAIEQELRDVADRMKSPDRSLFMYFMENDQRRHLSTHYESIDLHRVEFILPFFDPDFVQSVIENPIHDCLLHRLYMDVLSLFPEWVAAVPWQAYAGHVPCPHPLPRGYQAQWHRAPEPAEIAFARKAARRVLVGSLFHRSDRFPGDIFSRPKVAFFSTLAALSGRRFMDKVYPVARAMKALQPN